MEPSPFGNIAYRFGDLRYSRYSITFYSSLEYLIDPRSNSGQWNSVTFHPEATNWLFHVAYATSSSSRDLELSSSVRAVENEPE